MVLGLEDGDRRTIGYDTRRSNSVGLSACRHVVRWGDGLWEVRSDLSGGSIGRVIFCIAKGDMVLLHGFIKKTQKTPRRDIDLANQRRKEIE
jgi:phage-related protein